LTGVGVKADMPPRQLWLPGFRKKPGAAEIRAFVNYRLYGFELRQVAREDKRRRRRLKKAASGG